MKGELDLATEFLLRYVETDNASILIYSLPKDLLCLGSFSTSYPHIASVVILDRPSTLPTIFAIDAIA